MADRIRIATRKSPLALWQAEHVAARLRAAWPDRLIELLPISTRGDEILDTPLSRIGGKGLFIKELEVAMLNGDADIAVHSMKDVPAEMPPEFELAAIMERADPRDAFVSTKYRTVEELPQGAVVGSASLRRQCQLKLLRPDLDIRSLRGNVGTRLAKLDAGEFDAIILATAGLTRLGLDARIASRLPVEQCLPAIGQGTLGIECRRQDDDMINVVAVLKDPVNTIRTTAERAFNATLKGGCDVPIAGYAELGHDSLRLRGLLGLPDGSRFVSGEKTGSAKDAAMIGHSLAEELLAAGGDEILQQLRAME